MTQNALKMAPYGEANFSILRANNLAYVDKTEFIAELESFANRFPFIVRPRRFGKTLFTQTLQAYYDIAAAKDFERNFAGTYSREYHRKILRAISPIRFYRVFLIFVYVILLRAERVFSERSSILLIDC